MVIQLRLPVRLLPAPSLMNRFPTPVTVADWIVPEVVMAPMVQGLPLIQPTRPTDELPPVSEVTANCGEPRDPGDGSNWNEDEDPLRSRIQARVGEAPDQAFAVRRVAPQGAVVPEHDGVDDLEGGGIGAELVAGSRRVGLVRHRDAQPADPEDWHRADGVVAPAVANLERDEDPVEAGGRVRGVVDRG